MSKKPLQENEFALLATRSSKDGLKINFLKITRDWETYYDIPKDKRSSTLKIYESITSSSSHTAFLSYIQDKIKEGLDNNWSRHYRLKLAKEGSIFYDDNLVPLMENVNLLPSKNDSNDNHPENEDDLDLSVEELSRVFGKLYNNCS